jgi:hypothetical protein
MPQKKKIVKKKITKSIPRKGQVISQTVNVHVGGKSKSKSGTKQKRAVKATPPENRQSSGYILPQIPSWQVNPSYQPQFQKPEDRQLLIEDLKRQFPLLTYTPQQPAITQYGEPSIQEIPEEESTTFAQDVPQPIILSPPSEKQRIPSKGKSKEELTAISKDKLNSLGFPDRIAVSGANRSSDIDAVVQMMIDANRSGNKVYAIDLQRVYGIKSETVSQREQKLTGIQKERRPRKSEIPTLEEYNLR